MNNNDTKPVVCPRCQNKDLISLGPGNYTRDLAGNYTREMCYQCSECCEIIAVSNKN
jgi:hypothetical protein